VPIGSFFFFSVLQTGPESPSCLRWRRSLLVAKVSPFLYLSGGLILGFFALVSSGVGTVPPLVVHRRLSGKGFASRGPPAPRPCFFFFLKAAAADWSHAAVFMIFSRRLALALCFSDGRCSAQAELPPGFCLLLLIYHSQTFHVPFTPKFISANWQRTYFSPAPLPARPSPPFFIFGTVKVAPRSSRDLPRAPDLKTFPTISPRCRRDWKRRRIPPSVFSSILPDEHLPHARRARFSRPVLGFTTLASFHGRRFECARRFPQCLF